MLLRVPRLPLADLNLDSIFLPTFGPDGAVGRDYVVFKYILSIYGPWSMVHQLSSIQIRLIRIQQVLKILVSVVKNKFQAFFRLINI